MRDTPLHMHMAWRCAALLLVGALPLGCGAPAPAGNATYQVRTSIRQLQVTHAPPGAELAVYDAGGKKVQSGPADAQGSLIFRRLAPGSGYTVRIDALGQTTAPLSVWEERGSTPPKRFYSEQELKPGFNYIKTRDGTLLSAYITLPGPPDSGPYPTVVSYSGYDPSKPGKPLEQFSFLCNELPSICDPPSDPGALLASFFGYATVGVNMRGTGCSGGAYDYFETLQVTDGFDVIEAVAAQPWVKHNKVGMVGLSYPGISQLFVASAQPPSLAAITPLSVIGNTVTTLVPGGILNNGFALEWVSRVLDRADPYGQGWEKGRVAAGDGTCAENQLLHGQKVNNVEIARNTPYADPELTDPLNPTAFAPKIRVPLFLAGAFQDEQTGPFFTTLLDRFTGSPHARFTVYNGVHPDGFAPQVLGEWAAFLDLFVARQKPQIPAKVRSLAPLLFDQIFGAKMQLPEDRFAAFQSYDEAMAAYLKEKPLRAIFESGAGPDAGAPQGTFDLRFSRWPVPEVEPLRYYLQPGGGLSDKEPVDRDGASSFLLDPEAGSRGMLAPGGDVFDKLPAWDWKSLSDGKAVAFETPALAEDLVTLGTGSADLWIRSTADDADLQVNITEVRPDGQERYVQSGWLRASHQGLEAGSTVLWPEHSYRKEGLKALVPGEWTKVRVPIAAMNHIFRAGSRVRVSVDTPGGNRAAWRFQLKAFEGPVMHSVGHSAAQPSSVVLPKLPNVKVTTPLPICASLRGQPCRKYQPLRNLPAN